MIINYLLRIIFNIGFINIKRKHLYSINRPGRLLEGGAYFQHFKIRWALIRGGRLKEGGRLIEEIRYEYFENKHCIFWSNMASVVTASFDILNTKRRISPEREGFRGSNFDRFILVLYMFYW